LTVLRDEFLKVGIGVAPVGAHLNEADGQFTQSLGADAKSLGGL
jgi:hypothetical protein